MRRWRLLGRLPRRPIFSKDDVHVSVRKGVVAVSQRSTGCSSEWLLPFKKMLDDDAVDALPSTSKDGHHSRSRLLVQCIPYLLICERPFRT